MVPSGQPNYDRLYLPHIQQSLLNYVAGNPLLAKKEYQRIQGIVLLNKSYLKGQGAVQWDHTQRLIWEGSCEIDFFQTVALTNDSNLVSSIIIRN